MNMDVFASQFNKNFRSPRMLKRCNQSSTCDFRDTVSISSCKYKYTCDTLSDTDPYVCKMPQRGTILLRILNFIIMKESH